MGTLGELIAKRLGQPISKKTPTKPHSKPPESETVEYTIDDYFAFQRGENPFSDGKKDTTEPVLEDTDDSISVKTKRKAKKRQAKKKSQKKTRSFLEALQNSLSNAGFEAVSEDPSEYEFRRSDSASKPLPPPDVEYVHTKPQPLDIERTLGFLRNVRKWTIKLLIGIVQKELNDRFARLQEAIDVKVGTLEQKVMSAIQKANERLSDVAWFPGGGSTTVVQQITGPSTGSGLWVEFEDTVAGSDTGIFDEILIANFRSSKYILEAEDTVTGDTKRMEISALNMNGSLCHSVYNKLGTLDVTVDFLDIAGTATLVVNNNSTNAIIARVYKLSIVK